jgi:hypothetical protein
VASRGDRRQRSQRRLETMLRLLDKPGAERIFPFPDVEAAKADFQGGWLSPGTR